MFPEQSVVVPSLDSPQAQAAWELSVQKQEFWDAHYAEYLEKYPEKFVAVVGGEVVATSDHLMELLDELKRQGIEPQNAWLQFITADPYRILR
jgi:hypothetical protein